MSEIVATEVISLPETPPAESDLDAFRDSLLYPDLSLEEFGILSNWPPKGRSDGKSYKSIIMDLGEKCIDDCLFKPGPFGGSQHLTLYSYWSRAEYFIRSFKYELLGSSEECQRSTGNFSRSFLLIFAYQCFTSVEVFKKYNTKKKPSIHDIAKEFSKALCNVGDCEVIDALASAFLLDHAMISEIWYTKYLSHYDKLKILKTRYGIDEVSSPNFPEYLADVKVKLDQLNL